MVLLSAGTLRSDIRLQPCCHHRGMLLSTHNRFSIGAIRVRRFRQQRTTARHHPLVRRTILARRLINRRAFPRTATLNRRCLPSVPINAPNNVTIRQCRSYQCLPVLPEQRDLRVVNHPPPSPRRHHYSRQLVGVPVPDR